MRCYTATMAGTNEIAMDLFIDRPVRRSGHGIRAWLGHPFDVNAQTGPQNEGRPCDFIEVDDQFLLDKPAGDGDDQARITRCSIDSNGLAGRLRLLPETETNDGNLVLLRIVHSVDPGVQERVIKFESSPLQLAEGYAVSYDRVSNSRRPVSFVTSRVEEKLIRLAPGDTYRFFQIEPEARVLGMAIHQGRRTTYQMAAASGGVVISKVAADPLNVPVFAASALSDDMAVALMCLIVGIICGVIVSPASLAILLQILVGVGISLPLFGLTLIARYLYARATIPTYMVRGRERRPTTLTRTANATR